MKALQWMLTHSLEAKLMDVKRVTENKGKRTPLRRQNTLENLHPKTNGCQIFSQEGLQSHALAPSLHSQKERKAKT
ncbi:MAG: reverse transcriptase N-terminal domain-containing protein, partial [Clostridiales bacterium]|nr:reverse transcriptase N-terminal domain-containing protein [Clostridiales bacterium]